MLSLSSSERGGFSYNYLKVRFDGEPYLSVKVGSETRFI
jgi:hypothetical protein